MSVEFNRFYTNGMLHVKRKRLRQSSCLLGMTHMGSVNHVLNGGTCTYRRHLANTIKRSKTAAVLAVAAITVAICSAAPENSRSLLLTLVAQVKRFVTVVTPTEYKYESFNRIRQMAHICS